MNKYLNTPISDVSRSFKLYANRLEKLNILKVEDFLYHIPSRYENYSLVTQIESIQEGEVVTIKGTIQSIKNEYTRSHKTLQKAVVIDDTGSIDIVWFNQPFLTKYLKKGDLISMSGRVSIFSKGLVMESPEYEVLNGDSTPIHTGRIVPIYPETKGVSSKWLRRQIYLILKSHSFEINDFLPDEIIKSNNYLSLLDAIKQIHFPDNFETISKARERLSFDELFLHQLASQLKKKEWAENVLGHSLNYKKYINLIEKFKMSLPFTLTDSQINAVNDILNDMTKTQPMNRLLQGDVGSGKTVVSAIASYLAFLNGFQSSFMAPTEILAQQHFSTLSKLLEPFGMKVKLVTSSNKLIKGENKFDILVGTHAILSEKIQFEKLGLVVIDEQQRFGVEQRSIIRNKGQNPHLLTMTATPIPRTIALTLYGNLDLSYLNQMPKGRRIIKTWLVPEVKREGAYHWIQKQIKENKDQVFIICPFIEESESMQTVKAAKVEFERLAKDIFPDLKLGLLHGKLKAKEKDKILTEFREQKLDILVATPVVEVGIDIPNATIIVIEASERFGLAQLHQLRGRVGRGNKQSFCLLFTQTSSPKSIQRLKGLEVSQIGAELAELDLKLRGPGEMYGTAQSGVKELKIASFSDFPLIQKARNEAVNILGNLSIYPSLLKKVEILTKTSISPD